jgi:hypothetical protein
MLKFRKPSLPKMSLPSASKQVKNLAAQAVGVLAVLVGIAHWSIWAAFIVGGLTVILAIETN